MAEKVLIVIDMQNDFVTGCLGTTEAKNIVDNVKEKINQFDGKVIFTKDTHFENYLETQEGKLLPIKHCIKDTIGWDIIPELAIFQKNINSKVYEKNTFSSIKLAEDLKNDTEIKEIELIGVCTDICVVSNALLLKAYMPEIVISVDEKCCAGVTPEKHKAAIQTMQSCQINIK